jgi:hypothetical protein
MPRHIAIAFLLLGLNFGTTAIATVPGTRISFLESQVQIEYQRLIKRYKDDARANETLSAAQKSWRIYLTQQCDFEQELPLTELKLRMEESTKLRRSGRECTIRLLELRLQELQSL